MTNLDNIFKSKDISLPTKVRLVKAMVSPVVMYGCESCIVKTITLIGWTFVSKVMSLLYNMLSRLVIDFLPRSKHLLISWLQSSSAVILEPKKIKSVTISIVYPSICHEVSDGTRCHDLSFH